MRISGYYFDDGNFVWVCTTHYRVFTIANNTGDWVYRTLSKEHFMEMLTECTGFGEFTLKD